VRVRAGLGAYTDKAGQVWAADTGFTGGNADHSTAKIAGTTDPALYQGERWGNFSYKFAVPNGTYTVTLKFAENTWTQKGQRVFNVALNGQAVLTNFDILAQVAPHTALDKSFTVAVTGGTLTAAFTTVTDAATLQALQIVAVPSANVPAEHRVGEVPTETQYQRMLYRRVPVFAVESPMAWRVDSKDFTSSLWSGAMLVRPVPYATKPWVAGEGWRDSASEVFRC
jgi:hypothetical protein